MRKYSIERFKGEYLLRHDDYIEDVATLKLKDQTEMIVTCGRDMEIRSYRLENEETSVYLGVESYYSILQINDSYFIVGGMKGIFVIFSIEDFMKTFSLSESVHEYSGGRKRFMSNMMIVKSLCRVGDRKFLAGDTDGMIYLFEFHPKKLGKSPVRRISDSIMMESDLPISLFCKFDGHNEQVVCLLKKSNFFFSGGGMSIDFQIRKWKIYETSEEKERRRTSSMIEALRDRDTVGPFLEFPMRHRHRIMNLCFVDQEETKIVSSSLDDELFIWDLEGNVLQKLITKNQVFLSLLRLDFDGLTNPIFLGGTTRGSLVITYFEKNPKEVEVVRKCSWKYLVESKKCHGNWIKKVVPITMSGNSNKGIIYGSVSADGLLSTWKIREESMEETEGEDDDEYSKKKVFQAPFNSNSSPFNDVSRTEKLKREIERKKSLFERMKTRYRKAMWLEKIVDKKRILYLERTHKLNEVVDVYENLVYEETVDQNLEFE